MHTRSGPLIARGISQFRWSEDGGKGARLHDREAIRLHQDSGAQKLKVASLGDRQYPRGQSIELGSELLQSVTILLLASISERWTCFISAAASTRRVILSLSVSGTRVNVKSDRCWNRTSRRQTRPANDDIEPKPTLEAVFPLTLTWSLPAIRADADCAKTPLMLLKITNLPVTE